MLSTTNVKSALKIDVAITPLMAEALQLWSLMYSNQSPWLNSQIKSLNLPAAIASEISRSVTIEMDAEITGSKRADFLYKQMEKVISKNKIRQQVEYGVAKGGLVFKPYISGDQIAVDFVQADQFYPVAFDANGNMTACVFSDTKVIGRDYYTRLEYHSMQGNNCTIVNTAYKSTAKDTLGNQVPLTSVDAWAELLPEATIANIDRPLFAYFKYPLANNIDPTSPLGVSAYSRATDLIKQADIQWSDFLWEFESAQRALYTDPNAFKKDEKTGKPILPDRRLYRLLDLQGAIDKQGLFEDWTPTIREQNYINGLETIYRLIEFHCGLAEGCLPRPAALQYATATEIKMTKQRTYSTITDAQGALEDALENLLYAMDVWATIGNLAPKGAYNAVFYFDDSIVADHDTQFAQDSQAVGLGVMSKVEFRMNNYGETEEVARKYIKMIASEQDPNNFFPPEAPQ